jgi:hypothetical protein
MPLEAEHEALRLIARQRCFYLFLALFVLLVSIPFLEDTPRGRMTLNVINVSILAAALTAVARSPICLVTAALLAIPTVGFQMAYFFLAEDGLLVFSHGFGAAFYFVTVCYLLGYVLRRQTFTVDKLYGGAAAFLMLGLLWAYLYAIVLAFYPGALAAGGAPMASYRISDIVYFSYTTLTSTGFGDIIPAHPVARMVCVLEQLTGVLFIAILIARLAGVYPPAAERPR